MQLAAVSSFWTRRNLSVQGKNNRRIYFEVLRKERRGSLLQQGKKSPTITKNTILQFYYWVKQNYFQAKLKLTKFI